MRRNTFNRDEFAADELENEQHFYDARQDEQPYSHLAEYTMIPDPDDDAHIAGMSES
ncbi:MAG: hypothetical protein FWD58_04520 [Firmicutes bacterium]|nr:hypothetical protein [Bacillota bacterium]